MKRGLGEQLKHNLVPSEENDFHPRFFHIEIFSVFLILAVALQLFVGSGIAGRIVATFPTLSSLGAVLPALLAAQTNDYRLAQHEMPLKQSDVLARAAEMKAEDMVKRQYFSHTDPDGQSPWKWFEAVGYEYSYAGENLAVDFIDSKDVTDAWIKSTTHRANLVSGNFTEIGIGTATGVFEGKTTTFVVQFFGKPAPVAIAKPIQTDSAARVVQTKTKAAVSNASRSTTTAATNSLALASVTSASSSATSTATSSGLVVAFADASSSGQVLGFESEVVGEGHGGVSSRELAGTVLYSSKQISITAIEMLIILAVFALLFSITYSIAHHQHAQLLSRFKLAILSHKKTILHTVVFVALLFVLLIVFVSTGTAVKI